MNYILNDKNPAYIFKNFLSYKKNSVINITRNKQKLEEHIDNSLKLFNDFSEKFTNQINLNLNKRNEYLNIKKSLSEKQLIKKNNSKIIHNDILIEQKIKNEKKQFEQNYKKNNRIKIKYKNSKKNNNKSTNNISNELNNNNLPNHYSKKQIFIFKKNKSNPSINKRKKENKIKYKKEYFSLMKKLNYTVNLFKRNPNIDLITNYSKKNFKRSTFSSNEKTNILKENENYSLIQKKEKTILKDTKSIKKNIKNKLLFEKKFYKERKYFHSAKQRKIKSLIRESKFIDNINKKKIDNIKDIKHYINFTKLTNDLNFVYRLNNSVVYSQRDFLKEKYDKDKGKTINYYYNKFFFD